MAALKNGPQRLKKGVLKKLAEKEFQRYLLVGLIGVIMFEGLFFLLNFYLPYWISYLVSFELITTVNFLMHDSITFKGKKYYSLKKRFMIFESQAVVYRIIQYILFFAISLFINIYLSLLIAIFIAFFYSYSVNKKVTWKTSAI